MSLCLCILHGFPCDRAECGGCTQVRNLTDLLVEDDAMERAQEAVCAIQRKGFDPISLVDSQPHVLLMHEHYFPSRDRLLKMLRRCG